MAARSVPSIRRRDVDPSLPILNRLYAARGEDPYAPPDLALKGLLAPSTMKGLGAAAAIVADAVVTGQRIICVGDYDLDGGGSIAVAMNGLEQMGARDIDFLIPDRLTQGYGLSPALADEAAERGCDVMITMDNGIAAHAGVARARSHNMTVVVTDHHLAGETLPLADVIVNPNQPGCDFASKNISGCGVVFYLLLAVRAALREQGWFERRAIAYPNLAPLLDIVALSTVGDVVRLDRNNRILVNHGIQRIRAGYARPGIAALMTVSGTEAEHITASDFGFRLGPRINASGRLDDMSIGVRCLLSSTPAEAMAYAGELDAWNRRRREIEADMREDAFAQTESREIGAAIVVSNPEWHEGVVGLVASRLKEHYHRPTIAFAASHGEIMKGSGRSIPGFHLRDALALVAAQHPGAIAKFGGHAMAAGLSVPKEHFSTFESAFMRVCAQWLTEDQMNNVIESDGELTPKEITTETARLIESAGPWGQGFLEPVFDGSFRVESVTLMGAEKQHVRYTLDIGGNPVNAVHFGAAGSHRQPGQSIDMAYKLNVNRWLGRESLQLMIEHAEEAGPRADLHPQETAVSHGVGD